MRNLFKYIVFICLFVSSAYAQPDQISVDASLGVFGTEGSSLSQVKFAKVGWQEDVWGALKQKISGGAWLDTRGPGFSSSLFTGYQLGFEVTNEVFQASIWSGPAFITSPDQDLGGNFQFNETIFFGIVDKNYDTVGIAYNHFSSGGLEMPNLGKDFLGLEIKWPF